MMTLFIAYKINYKTKGVKSIIAKKKKKKNTKMK